MATLNIMCLVNLAVKLSICYNTDSGQLVVYPILNLKEFAPEVAARKALLGMKWYIHNLEQLVIDLCQDYGISANRSPHTGVWVGNNKICAMGVHNSKLVTSHGLALNCNTDLDWFSHIVPCGIQGRYARSLDRISHGLYWN